jgi:hypothetical protein
MSDFLTNLVMRSFAQTPSVQPVTLSTYAAPEAPVTLEPVQKTEVIQGNTDVSESVVVKEVPLVTKSSPTIIEKIVPAVRFEHSEVQEPEPTRESVVREEEPRVMSKPDQTIAAPLQTPLQRIVKPPVQVRKVTEPSIVEQVTERVVERPTVKSIERPSRVTAIEQSTIETIEQSSVRSIERSIENSSLTIENTEHVTNSFTTLVPKVTPQSLPALNSKHRPTHAQTPVPGKEQQQTPATPRETVVNVAIGRIEVRATPAPAPKRERQQGPKVMTLDDYMQQRSRGAQ